MSVGTWTFSPMVFVLVVMVSLWDCVWCPNYGRLGGRGGGVGVAGQRCLDYAS